MNKIFLKYREEYPDFIYKSFSYTIDDNLNISFNYIIPGLEEFNHKIIIPKEYIKIDYDKDYLEYIIFNIGMIEIINYIKCTCSRNIIVDAGYINDKQIDFFKKLYYKGLGELLYRNNIQISLDELFDIKCNCSEISLPKLNYTGEGNLICVGGGKDSCVSLELLKNEDNYCLVINPKDVTLNCCNAAGYSDDRVVKVRRIIDPKILDINDRGFLNGHIPFSSVVAFISYLVAYLLGRKNIILSNEASANQETVIGTDVNHQYSKTFEAECDFRDYVKDTFDIDINYFSLLRGLSEFNIAKLFSHYKKYHHVFRSCNLGSKNDNWNWCLNCPKCLFIYIILSPFIEREELVSIFGEDLYEREDLLDTFKEIIGYSDSKPFECVGTYEEARYAISLVINRGGILPYLLQYYKDNYDLELDGSSIEKYNDLNDLNDHYDNIVRKELDKYV